MAGPQVFISYRRDDTAGYARALHDTLARRWGADRVFVDVDDIGAGAPFAEVIGREVSGAQVLLVLIGQRWRGLREDGRTRLDEPGDFVRREVATGLAQGMRVVPLLLDGAAMPMAAELPDELKPLAGRNAVVIDAASFNTDVQRLADQIGGAMPTPGRRRVLLGAGAVAAVAAMATAGIAWLRPKAPEPAPVPRAALNGEWQASVVYDWPNANYTERFQFTGEGRLLQGTAGFLTVPRGIAEGALEGQELRFSTRTREIDGGEFLHRYRGRLAGDEIRFVMQTEGGTGTYAPVEFTARRVGAPGRP